MYTDINNKKRKKEMRLLGDVAQITPSENYVKTTNVDVPPQSDIATFPEYPEKATTDRKGLYKVPSVSSEENTQPVESEPLKDIPTSTGGIDLSRDTRYKKIKEDPPYDPFATWLEDGRHKVGNSIQSYIEMQENLREYLEKTKEEITSLEKQSEVKIKEGKYASDKIAQLDKAINLIDEHYDFYSLHQNDMFWWKTPEEMADELAFLSSEKAAAQALQARLGKTMVAENQQTTDGTSSNKATPQIEKLSLSATSPPQPAEPSENSNLTAQQNNTSTGNKNTEYTLPTETQAKSLTYWLNRSVGTYNFRDVEMMIPALQDFAKTLGIELKGKYYAPTTMNHIVNTRTRQIDTAISMVDWYIDYITNNHDEVNEVYGHEEIDDILEELKGLQGSLSKGKVDLQVETVVRKLYSGEGEYLAYNNYDAAVSLLNQGVAEIIRLTDLLEDPKYLYTTSDLPEDIDIREAKKLIEEQIASWNKRLEPLEKSLTNINTQDFRNSVQKMIDEGTTYEDLESLLSSIEKNINACQRAYNWAIGANNRERRNRFKELANKFTEQKQVILAQMSYVKDIGYSQYRKEADWNQMSRAKVPELQNEPQIRAFLKNNVNNPYYYINDTFGMRKYYKTQSESGSDFNANGSMKNAHRYGGMMYTEKRPTGEFEVYDYMTEEEIRTYNYIYNKFGEKTSNEYLESLTDQKQYSISVEGKVIESPDGLNYRWGVIDASDDNFFEKIGTSLSAGLGRFGLGLRQLFNKEPIETSKLQYQYKATVGNASREGKMLYGAINKIGEEIPSILLSAMGTAFGSILAKRATTAISIASKTGNAYNSAINQGYNSIQAYNYATLIGASELCFALIPSRMHELDVSNEQWGDIIAKRVTEIDKGYLRAVSKMGNAVIYGSESALKEMLRPLYECYIFEKDFAIDFEEVAYQYILAVLKEIGTT